METERQDLLNDLATLSDEQAMEHPNDEWSAKQHVAHLVEGEPEWLGWALAIHHWTRVTVGQPMAVDQPFLRDIAEAAAKPLAWRLTGFGRPAPKTLQRIHERNLSNANALEGMGVQRIWGEMTVLQLLRGIYRPNHMHRDRLQGQEQSFTPRPGAPHTP